MQEITEKLFPLSEIVEAFNEGRLSSHIKADGDKIKHWENYMDSLKSRYWEVIGTKEEKKVIGYKWKDGCQNYHEAVSSIVKANPYELFHPLFIDIRGILFYEASDVSIILKQAGVLDLWFEPVYEEETLSSNIQFSKPNEKAFDGSATRIVEIDELFTFHPNLEYIKHKICQLGGIPKEMLGDDLCKYNPQLQTKEEVDKYKAKLHEPLTDLSNTKIWIGNNPELSRKVQEKAIEIGCEWVIAGRVKSTTKITSIYIDEEKKMSYDDDYDEKYFKKHSYKEIFPSDLGINIPEEQPKSDIESTEYNTKSNIYQNRIAQALGYIKAGPDTWYDEKSGRLYKVTKHGLKKIGKVI